MFHIYCILNFRYSIIYVIRMDYFFLLLIFNRLGGARIFVTQRGPARLVTCLAHWISFNGSVLYTLRCTSTYTLLCIALFVIECPKNSHLPPPPKKRNTTDVDLLDRARSFLRSRNARRVQGWSTTIEGSNLFSWNS